MLFEKRIKKYNSLIFVIFFLIIIIFRIYPKSFINVELKFFGAIYFIELFVKYVFFIIDSFS